MLKLEPRGPIRVTLIAAKGKERAVFVEFAPVAPAMRRRALAEWRARLEAAGVAEVKDASPVLLGDLDELMSRELIRMGAVRWQGIADEAGQLLDITPDRETRLGTANAPDRPTGTIDLVLANEDIFALLDQGYVRPEALRYAEKNVLSGSPSGTSAAATPDRIIAASPAASRGAGRKARRTAAKTARTPGTRSGPSKPKASGKR